MNFSQMVNIIQNMTIALAFQDDANSGWSIWVAGDYADGTDVTPLMVVVPQHQA